MNMEDEKKEMESEDEDKVAIVVDSEVRFLEGGKWFHLSLSVVYRY